MEEAVNPYIDIPAPNGCAEVPDHEDIGGDQDGTGLDDCAGVPDHEDIGNDQEGTGLDGCAEQVGEVGDAAVPDNRTAEAPVFWRQQHH